MRDQGLWTLEEFSPPRRPEVRRQLGNRLHFHLQAEPAPPIAVRLSARQRDVAALIAEGCSNRQIAAALRISVDTAKHHVGDAMDIEVTVVDR